MAGIQDMRFWFDKVLPCILGFLGGILGGLIPGVLLLHYNEWHTARKQKEFFKKMDKSLPLPAKQAVLGAFTFNMQLPTLNDLMREGLVERYSIDQTQLTPLGRKYQEHLKASGI